MHLNRKSMSNSKQSIQLKKVETANSVIVPCAISCHFCSGAFYFQLFLFPFFSQNIAGFLDLGSVMN